MTRILLFVVALAVSAPAAAAERRYSVTDFDRVIVEGPYRVRLSLGRPSSAVASGSQAALDRVVVDVSGQTLRIRRNRSYWGGNPGAQEGPLEIALTTRTLRLARTSGPATLEIDGAQGLRVDLIVEGSGRIRAGNLRVDQLGVGLRGSGRLELAGTAERVSSDIQGSGDLDASALRADDATIATTTSGNVAIEVVRSATVTAAGVGAVEILGRPACTLRGPAAGMVRCGDGQPGLDQR